ncbi:hypothetical protein ACLMJK_001956 [Lecanora helva]
MAVLTWSITPFFDWSHLTFINVLRFSGLACILYVAALASYRLFFHPLAGFPGPKLAASTYWYEFFYDCAHKGQYVFKIGELHKQYGPIIRINPEEIHVADADFYNEIYTNREKRDVWDWQRKGFGSDVSTIATANHELHRRRRAAWNPVFSKQRIMRLQPVIQERVDALLNRIQECGAQGEIINLKHGFAAYAADVSSRYFFNIPQEKVEAPDFDPEFHNAIQDGFNNVLLLNQLPWLMDILVFIAHYPPPWLLKRFFVSSKMTKFVTVLRILGDQAKAVIARPLAKEESSSHTVFDQILSSPHLPPQEKSLDRLKQDAQMLIVASTLSTSWSITVAAYELLAHPRCLRILKEELHSAFPQGPETMHDLATLQQLPYLWAVIQESLRIGIAISHRSARISPVAPTIYKDPSTGAVHAIPPGTPMSMSHPLLFRDPSLFPEPTTFRPERWLENDRALEKYQFAFSKGTRGCPAINLAMVEMVLPVAHLFARYGSRECRMEGDVGMLELYETSDRDIECAWDGGIAMAEHGSVGVRVRVVK